MVLARYIDALNLEGIGAALEAPEDTCDPRRRPPASHTHGGDKLQATHPAAASAVPAVPSWRDGERGNAFPLAGRSFTTSA